VLDPGERKLWKPFHQSLVLTIIGQKILLFSLLLVQASIGIKPTILDSQVDGSTVASYQETNKIAVNFSAHF